MCSAGSTEPKWLIYNSFTSNSTTCLQTALAAYYPADQDWSGLLDDTNQP